MLNDIKVLLVQPTGVQEGFTREGTKLPPLGLLNIAASIRYIADTRLIDGDALNLDDFSLLASLNEWVPSLVGVTVSSLTLEVVSRFAHRVKQSMPITQIIAGGPLATTAPEQILKFKDFDFVGVGDGEAIMPDLCKALGEHREPEVVDGVLTRKILAESSLKLNPRRVSLSIVKQPAWDMLPNFNLYKSPDCLQSPVTIVEGQRGCPHHCTFCSVGGISGNFVRARPIHNILDEISYLTLKRNVREISFVDPDFMANKIYAESLSDGINRLGNNITWFCNARASSVKESIARKMNAAGCHLIYLGIESGDPEILARINKHQTLEQIEKACNILRNCGIQVSAGFIIGFPFETDENILRTIEFAKRLKPAKFQFNIFNWFPGISMDVPKGYSFIGFHPKNADPRLLEWQRRAYHELEN
jgi:anaerobic magnesium-protoporphyrin IX monomethyl ester cyclase